MSSIRLFVLDAFARHGPTHGHRVRALAQQENVTAWTDVSVGSLYQAIKRLDAEGMLEQVRVERAGNYPQRRVYRLTDAGRRELDSVLHAALRAVALTPDPFDLALSRFSDGEVAGAEGAGLLRVVADRLRELQRREAASSGQREAIDDDLGTSGRWAYDHTLHRLRAEIGWLEELHATLSGLLDTTAAPPAPDD